MFKYSLSSFKVIQLQAGLIWIAVLLVSLWQRLSSHCSWCIHGGIFLLTSGATLSSCLCWHPPLPCSALHAVTQYVHLPLCRSSVMGSAVWFSLAFWWYILIIFLMSWSVNSCAFGCLNKGLTLNIVFRWLVSICPWRWWSAGSSVSICYVQGYMQFQYNLPLFVKYINITRWIMKKTCWSYILCS